MRLSRACTPPHSNPTPDRSSRSRGSGGSIVGVNIPGEVDANIMPTRKTTRVERRLGLDDDDGDTEVHSSASYSTPRGSWPLQGTTKSLAAAAATPAAARQEEGRASDGSATTLGKPPSGGGWPCFPLTLSVGGPGTCGSSVGVALPSTTPCKHTPEVIRTGAASLAGGSCGMPVVQSLLYTPQIAPSILAMRNRLDQELNAVNEANRAYTLPAVTTLIPGKLYIGGFPDGETVDTLQAEGIRYVLNCAPRDHRTDPTVAAEFHVCDIDAFDTADYLILHHDLDTFTSIVDDVTENRREKIFVHCVAGINRSVTLCCAYLMEKLRVSPIDVVRLFRQNGRMRILENHGFRHQLVDHYLHGVLQGINDDDEEKVGPL